ncbi:MAG: hypothetical protein IKF50_05345 [Clostridia bacterium]|nr:hypothetical protein [Clostridia bacterium]
MNAVERTKNAMKCREVDRVPAGFYTHFPDQEDNTVKDQVRWAKTAAMDYLVIETDGFMDFHWDGPLKTTADWSRIRPHTKDDWYIRGQVDRAARIAEGLGDDCASFYIIYTPYSTIKHTVGGETAVNLMFRSDPAAITHAMQVIEEDNALLMEELSRTGLTGLFLSLQNGEKWRFTVPEYEDWMAPWDCRMLSKAKEVSEYNMIHLCSWGCEPNNIGLWKDMEYETVNWGVHIEEDLPLEKGHAYFGEDRAVMGGFDVRPGKLLQCGTELEIKRFTKALLDKTGERGVLLSGDCSVQKETDEAHMRWVTEACEEYAAHRGWKKIAF